MKNELNEQRGWELVIFDWFVLSMGIRMQGILDSLFARPGSAPIGGGKNGEFRDWTSRQMAALARQLDTGLVLFCVFVSSTAYRMT